MHFHFSVSLTQEATNLSILTMANTVAGGLHKVQEVIRSAAGEDKKVADLLRDTADVHKKAKFTTDFGVPVADTDHSLKAVNENTSGPSLLEDQIAREKVSFSSQHFL
jgi:catalase